MEPSNTVRASFAIMVIWIVGVMVKIIPEVISQASGYWWFWGKKHARLFNSGVWRIPLSPIVLRRGEAE
ncbi:MAG: hypothetical protein ACI8UZ_001770 [Akkermansiaceae bacterium]|jgi:hypothetical protein